MKNVMKKIENNKTFMALDIFGNEKCKSSKRVFDFENFLDKVIYD